MFDLREMVKGNTLPLVIFGIVLVLLLAIYGIGKVHDMFNQEANDNNLAVAVSAKKDLDRVIESNNRLANDFEEFKRVVTKNQELSNEIKKIEAEARVKQNELVDIISGIDTTTIKYVEEPVDIEKSRIIINTIWEAYSDEQANTQKSK